MEKIIKIYLYIFIPVSLLTGYLLREGYTISGLTPSLFASAFIFIVIVFEYFNKVLVGKKINIEVICSFLVFVFIPIIYISINGIEYIIEEYKYSINILLPIITIFYLSYHSKITSLEIDKILQFCNVVLIINIIISWIFDIGYASYTIGGQEIGKKGFLYGGNTASVLSIAVLSYYLFDKNNNYSRYLLIILSLLASILAKTIASFIAPILVVIYLITKIKYKYTIPLGIIIIIISPLSFQNLNNYLDDNYRFQRIKVNESGSFILQYAESSRRIIDSYKQIQYQIENPITIIFGTGRSGQIEFWDRDEFTFSGTDISDLLMRYGLVGFILIVYIFVVPALKYAHNNNINNVVIGSLLVMTYSFMGGYVFTSITALMYMSLLISKLNKTMYKLNNKYILYENK